jgi:hypothetical protein
VKLKYVYSFFKQKFPNRKILFNRKLIKKLKNYFFLPTLTVVGFAAPPADVVPTNGPVIEKVYENRAHLSNNCKPRLCLGSIELQQ